MRFPGVGLVVALLIAAPSAGASATAGDDLPPAYTPGVSRVFNGIAAGAQTTAFIDSSYKVMMLGSDFYGELGPSAVLGARTASPVPVGFNQPVWAVASGSFHTLALLDTGAVYAWGNDQYGQIGDRPTLGTTGANVAPTRVATDVTAIAGGGNHSMLLGKDGRVRTMGQNNFGQLGRPDNAGTNVPNPAVAVVDGLTDVVSIAAGSSHSVALRRDGTVWTFGDNTFGQLGWGNAGAYSATVGQVQGLTDVVAIAAGFVHNLALRRDGTVWSWGRNIWGQLGRPTSFQTDAPNLTPVAISGLTGITQIAAGSSHSLALRSDGRILSWGSNLVGQLGIAGDAGVSVGFPVPREVPAPNPVIAISSGSSHSIAVQSDGSIWAWGWNIGGQVGAPATNNDQPFPTPVKIQGTAQTQAPRSRPLGDSITRVATGAGAGSAALVNLTMTSAANAGYITADKCSAITTGAQTKSNGNHAAVDSIANLSVVPVDNDGTFCIYNEQQVHLIADLQGVFSPGGALRFDPVPPARLLDTRAATPPTGIFSISRVQTPYAGSVAALVNLTMVAGPLYSGYITADKCSTLQAGPQSKSNGNFSRNTVIANLAVVALDPDGSFCVLSDAPVDRIVDIQGVFSPLAQTRLTALAPSRVLDTRATGPAGANTLTRVDTARAGAASVLVNLTMTGGTETGYVTADKCSALTSGEQTKSNGNFQPARDIANLSVVPVDSDGSFCIYASATTHLIVDVQGTFSAGGTLGLDIVGPTRLLDTRVG